MKTRSFFQSVLAVLVLLGTAMGQGILVPHDHPHPYQLPRPIVDDRPPTTYRVEQLEIDTSIRDQVAQTRVTQTFENTGREAIQAIFVFPLPYDGAIESMTFMVDGKELDGKILPADEARRIYESYLRRYQDPALLQWMGHGMFQTSVFPIPPGAKRQVVISYSQLLRKNEATTDFLFPLATAQYTDRPIENLRIRVAIESEHELKNIYSPSHSVEVQRDDARHAVARFSASGIVPTDDFRLIYDTAAGAVGANLISYWPDGEDQGYFVLLASPQFAQESQTPAKKTLIFVIDRSGSMSGEKIEQAREAAKFIANNLRDDDLFNIIVYDDHVELFRPELQRYSDETRSTAIGFINGLNAGGSTNIDAALQTALGQFQSKADAPFVIFLTDGLPTAGETNEMKIVDHVRQWNQHRTRMICFGVGYDVNSRLLDRLSRANFGQSEYVRPDQNIEEAISRLYKRISSPVLTEMNVDYRISGVQVIDGDPVNRVYPAGPVDLFRGEQLVVVGRYRKSGEGKIVLRGALGDQLQSFEFDVKFAGPGETPQNRFAEKIWAARRIGEIIDLLDLDGHNQELVDELVKLSQRHGIITPYTSYLADENQDYRRLSRFDLNANETREQLQMLGEASGASGFGQRAGKAQFKAADNASAIPSSPDFSQNSFGDGAGRDGQMGIVNQNGRTFYKRGKTVISANVSDVDLEKEKDKIVEIKRFSDQYFQLVEQNTADENAMLASQGVDDELIVQLRGQIYRIQ